MSGYRPKGLLAIGVGLALAASGCGEPDLNTNLRPEGAPEVLTVMVFSDQLSDFGGLQVELATYCKSGDEKVPTYLGLPDQSVLQVCPEPGTDDPPITMVANADPSSWHVRVVFDELLDPDIEQLTDVATGGDCTDTSDVCEGHIAAAHPFTLDCGAGAVDYDGYYSPNGNNVSYPPGPGLVVAPNGFLVATGSTCNVSLVADTVTDKDGTTVPADQLGPWSFQISLLAILATDPEPVTAPDPNPEEPVDFTPTITFNAPIDLASIDATDITLTTSAGAPVAFTVTADGTSIVIDPDADLTVGETYTLTISGAAEFADIAGGANVVGEDIVLTFVVVAA